MAKKYKELKEKQELDLWYKRAKTIRKPEYIKDFNELKRQSGLSGDKNSTTIFDKMHKIMVKYNLQPSKYENDKKFIQLDKKLRNISLNLMRKYDIPMVFDPNFPQEISVYSPIGFGTIKPFEYNWSLHKLAKERYIPFIIDIYEDIENLDYDLEQWWSSLKNFRERILKIPIPKKPHLKKFERRIKVFDLRNNKPPVKFKKIAAILIKSGYCRNKSIEEVANLAVIDYQVAFKEIYCIPYKKFDKSKIKKSDFKGCDTCLKKKNCTELCADMEYLLGKGSQKEALFKRGVTDVIPSEVLQEKKKRNQALKPEDEDEWRFKSFKNGMYRKNSIK